VEPDNLIVAIPSYRRAEALRDKTLALLASHFVDPERIEVFVASEEERRRYEKVLPPESYGKLIVGEPGMRAIRNFIQMHYPPGQPLLCIDDDIDGLYELTKDGTNIEPLRNFAKMVALGFAHCSMRNFHLWGIYPVDYYKWMSSRVTFDLRYIEGAFWGVINDHDPRTMVTMDDKEDFERSIRYYVRDGGVVRMMRYAMDSKYYGGMGGMQDSRTEASIEEGARKLVGMFPELCSLNPSKKSSHMEVRLRDRRER